MYRSRILRVLVLSVLLLGCLASSGCQFLALGMEIYGRSSLPYRFTDNSSEAVFEHAVRACSSAQYGEILPKHYEEVKGLVLENPFLRDIESIVKFRNTEYLRLRSHGVEDFSPLASLQKLERADLSNSNIHDLTPLSEIPTLESLSFSFCVDISDLIPLARLPDLKRLDLSYCNTGFTSSPLDLSGLRECPGLEELALEGAEVHDLTPLVHVESLRLLILIKCPANGRIPEELKERERTGSLRIMR